MYSVLEALRIKMITAMSVVDSFAQRLYFHLVETFPADRKYGNTELASLPYAVGHYLSRRLESYSRREFDDSKLKTSPWFASDVPEVDRALEVLKLALGQHAHYPENVWDDELKAASDSISRFAVAPVRTLSSRLSHASFADASDEALINEVRNFSAYPLFLSETEAWITEGKIRSWSVDYPRLIREEIGEWAKHNSPQDWTVLVRPIYSLADEMGDDEVSIELIGILFEDLDLGSYFQRIDAYAKRNGRKKISGDEYVRALSSEITEVEVQEEFAFPDVASENQPVPTIDPVPETVSPDVSPDRLAAEDREPATPEPIWKKFQDKLNAPLTSVPAQAPRTSEYSTEVQPSDVGEQINNPLWERFRGESQTSVSTSGNVQAITVNDDYILGNLETQTRERFVAELFGGRENEFKSVVQKLNEVKTWNEASQIIADEIFRKNRVNIYSETAVDFTNIVEKRLRK